MKKRKTTFIGMIVTAVCAVVAAAGGAFAQPQRSAAEGVPSNDSLVYRLDFSDAANRGKNAAGGSIGDAQIISDGGTSFTAGAVKGMTAFNVRSTGVRRNYAVIPGEVLNYDTVTLAGWFKIDGGKGPYTRMWEINKNANGGGADFISVMPYHLFQNDGLNFCVKKNGEWADGDENLFRAWRTDERGVPTEHYLLPVYDAWVHYAYVLSPSGVKLYQNGNLVKYHECDMTARFFYGENARLYLGATNMDGTDDFSGAFADIRVYSSELSAQDIASEYELKYTDFLTTQYDFEDGAKETVRGYDGRLVHQAKTEYDAERGGNVLVLDGSGEGDDRTSLEIPDLALHGHSALTVSMDAYIDSLTAAYSYIMAFEVTGGKHLLLAGKWASSDTLKLLCGLTGETNRGELSGNTPYNKWINITFTVDGSTRHAALYIDGMLVAESDDYEYNNAMFCFARRDDYAGKCSFGKIKFYGDRPFTGKLDDIKIYQTALTARQVMMINGITSIEDDGEAVRVEYDNLDVDYDGTQAKIELPERLGNGVAVQWTTSDDGVITVGGDVLIPSDGDKHVTLTATLKRGEATMVKEFELTVRSREVADPSIFFDTALDGVKFAPGSYMERLMKVNFELFMARLDPERLLYNYRLIAGLPTNGAESYGAWISTESDGAGQFEAHYIIALIKYCRSMPTLTYADGRTVLEMTKYMIGELKKCQDAFAVKNPEHAGFLGGISVDDFDAMAKNDGIRPDGKRVWVPWYMEHKQLEMLLDAYNYSPDAALRADAKEMLVKFADWCYNVMNKYTDEERAKMLAWEYGGMAEALWQTYGITKKTEHFKAAKLFEEQGFLDNLKNNVDVLTGKHANTTIPKILGCAAAYEVTGNADYKTICENAYEMIMTRTYANGSTSEYEHWRTPYTLDERFDSAETCCSYNMLKLSDYLFRWTGDKKYADYMENVYTNHILASMAPDTGLKTYLTNTEFGYYKIYHNLDSTFWCCSCTGMENFSMLNRYIYYTADDTLRVNMFYPSTVKLGDTLSVEQSGDFYAEQKTTFTVKGNGAFTLALRLPEWIKAGETATVKVNGQAVNVAAQDGYYNITRSWQDGDVVEYALPFGYRLDTLKGHTKPRALFYGPLMYVLDLGADDVRDVRTDADRLDKGVGYKGNISRSIVLDGTLETACSVECVGDDICLYMNTLNQGRLTFRPFNRVFHSRYAMYLDYYDTLEEAERSYTLPDTNERATEFKDGESLKAFAQYSTDGRNGIAENGMLVTPDSTEYKLMSGLSLSTPYVVEANFRPYAVGEEMHAGIYVLASAPETGLDKIKAYLACVYKAPNASTATLHLYKFDHRYIDLNVNKQIDVPEDGVFSLHVYVTETAILVFVNGGKSPALSLDIDRSFITESKTDVGIRTYCSKTAVDGLKVISADFETPGKNILQSVVTAAGAYKEEDYTVESFAAFTAAYNEAAVALYGSSATQSEINRAEAKLREAIAKLERRADTAALKNAVLTAKALKEECYTQESFAILAALLDELDGENLDGVSYERATEIEMLLKNAMFALVAVTPDVPTPDVPTPDVPTPDKPTPDDNDNKGNMVDATGLVDAGWKAAAIALICVSVALVIAAGAYAVIRKRRADKQK